MAKLSRVGPDESTSVKKLCQWSPRAFTSLMEVIKLFEVYERLDVKASGNAGRIARGEKLTMTNSIYNKLAKCDQKFFETESEKIINKKISVKTLVENNQTHLDVQKVYAVLSQISGFLSKQQVLLAYLGKFETIFTMKNFIGAEIKGKPETLSLRLTL